MKAPDGLTRFTETCSIDSRCFKKVEGEELREALSRCPSHLRESINDTEVKGYWVPCSFYNKLNYNNRNYNKKLWENVLTEQRDTVVGAPMLADHPAGDSDGNPKDICGVWIDAKLGEPERDGTGLVWGLLIPSGRLGEDLKDHLKNGLRVGTSSSGFGKLMSDGITVDPDTYQIERLADWVLNPSQGTFFSYDENENSVEDKSIRESKETALEERSNYIANIRDAAERYIRCHENPTTDEVVDYVLDTFNEAPFSREMVERFVKDYKLDESKSNIYLNTTKENIVRDSKIAKLEEKKFRKDMESFLEDANNIKDPQERLDEFKEIRSYLEDGACPDLREKIEAKIAEEEASIKTMLSERIEMKEEFGIESTNDLKEKLTKISEDVKVIQDESDNWKNISEKLQSKLNETKQQLDARPTEKYVEYLRQKNDSLTSTMAEQGKKAIAVVKNLTEAYKKLKEEKKALEEQIVDLEESIKSSNDRQALSEKASDMNFASYNTLKEKYEQVVKQNEALIKMATEQRSLIEKATAKNEKLQTLMEKNNKLARQFYTENAKARKKLKEAEVVEVEEEELNDLDKYYDELVENYGEQVEVYEKKIRNACTLTEAKNIFYREILPNLNESKEIDRLRLPESNYLTPEERKEYIAPNQLYKVDAVDRLPKGWV